MTRGAFVFLLACCPSVLLAQDLRDQKVNCRGVITSTLASGREHSRFSECLREAVPLTVRAIRDASGERDTVRLALLHRISYSIRDPELFESGVWLAGQAEALPPARVLGLSVALAQIAPTVSFGFGAEQFRAPLSEHCSETVFMVHHGAYDLDNGQHANAVDELRQTAGSILDEPSSPILVRRFARCVLLVVPDPRDEPSYEVPEWEDEEP